MIKYDKYKDSGVELLGDIPKHWGLCRLKDLGSLQNGISQGKDYFGFGYPFVSYGDIYNDRIELKSIDGLANSSKEDQKLYSVLEGDVFFTRTSETVDEIGISATALQTIKNATFSGFAIRLRPNKNKILKGFSNYFFKANINRLFLSKEISLVTRASLSQNKLNNLPVLIPNKTEQTAIATYLDSRTSAIDRKVALLEQKITHYQQLRKSLINETVCRGLNKTVKLKDSGIEWIGEIPEHWRVKRFKSFAQTIKGKNLEFFDEPFEKSLPNLSLEYLRNDEVVFPTYCYSPSKSILVNEDDYIIVWDGAGVGEILNGKEGYLSSTIAKIVVNAKLVYPKYFFHLRDNIEYTLKQIPAGMGIPHLNPFVLNNFPCPFPPLSEQTAIATYLDEKTQKIDSIVSNIKTQIQTLKELRKTLINDVVTGKIKVSS